MSYGGSQPPGNYPPPPYGYPPQGGYPPGYPPQNYQQPGGYPPGGYGAPPPYAGMGQRFLAALLDWLFSLAAQLPGWIAIGVSFGMAASSSDAGGQLPDSEANAVGGLMLLGYALLFVGMLAFGLYNIYQLGKTGATLGKRIIKIKVLDPMGQPLGFWKAFGRELVKGLIFLPVSFCLLFIPILILYFWPLWDPEKQGVYDKLFSTHVYDA